MARASNGTKKYLFEWNYYQEKIKENHKFDAFLQRMSAIYNKVQKITQDKPLAKVYRITVLKGLVALMCAIRIQFPQFITIIQIISQLQKIA